MYDLKTQMPLSQADRKKKQSKSSTTCVSIRWNKSQLLYASVGSLTVASFFSNQGGGIREKYRFLFILLTFYSKEVIKFYSTLKNEFTACGESLV